MIVVGLGFTVDGLGCKVMVWDLVFGARVCSLCMFVQYGCRVGGFRV